MEKNKQITTVTLILDMLVEFSREDALKMIGECKSYVESRNDLFPEENKK